MNDNVFWFFIYCVSAIIDLTIYLIFIKAFLKEKKEFGFIRSAVIFMAGLFNLLAVTIVKDPVFTLVSSTLIFTSLSVFLYTGSLIYRLFSGLLVSMIGTLSEAVTIIAINYVIFRISLDDFEHSIGYYLLGLFVSKIIFFTIVKLLIYFKISRNNYIPKLSWFILFIIPLLSILISYQIAINLRSYNFFSSIMAIFSFVSILIINVIVFTMFEALIGHNEIKEKYKMADHQLSIQRIHYNELFDDYKSTLGLKHDLKNHINILGSLLQSGNYDKAEKYLVAIHKNSHFDSGMINTCNPEMDAMISYKRRVAKNKGIIMDVDIQVPDIIPVEPMDICIILGNLLDNAIEACCSEKVQKNERKIDLSIKLLRNFLSIRISNFFSGEIIEDEGRFLSIKKNYNHHGYGIFNIERAVKKYNGSVKIDSKNKIFTVNIVLECN